MDTETQNKNDKKAITNTNYSDSSSNHDNISNKLYVAQTAPSSPA